MASEDQFDEDEEFEEEPEDVAEDHDEEDEDLKLDDLDDIDAFSAAVPVVAEDDEDLHPAVIAEVDDHPVVVGRVVAVEPDLDEDLVDEEEVVDEEEDEDEDEEDGAEALDVLLVREQALDDDLLRLGDDTRVYPATVPPIAGSEFTCRSCFLVKRRAQLADEERMICLDCA
jgi:hypothetical protein